MYNWRTKWTLHSMDWQIHHGVPLKRYWMFSNGTQRMPAGTKFYSTFEPQGSCQSNIFKHSGYLKYSIANVRDHILLVKSSMQMLSNQTCWRWRGITSFSSYPNLIGTHPWSCSIHGTSLTRWMQPSYIGGKLTTFLPAHGAHRLSIILFNGLDMDMCVIVGSKRKMLAILTCWLINSISTIQGCRDSRRNGSIRDSSFLGLSFVDWTRYSSYHVRTGFTTFISQSSWGEEYLYTMSVGRSSYLIHVLVTALSLYANMLYWRFAAREGII
jgi:hypothetical protein